MSQIEELQRRIMAAMDKVAQGIDGLGPANDGDMAGLQSELEDEKIVSAQLAERVLKLKKSHEQELSDLAEKTAMTRDDMSRLDLDIQRLRQANAELSKACQALTDAHERGVSEPHLINTALKAELDALRAARSADLTETDVIISALTPLLDDAGDNRAQENS
ncbi:MAG: hypothetical protein WBC93_14720 [Sulfitobacter sp.]